MQRTQHQTRSFYRPSLTPLFLISAAFVLIMSVLNLQALAETPLWSYQGAKWYGMLRSGNLLVGAESGLVALNGEKGVALWQRNDLKGIREDEYHELADANLLLVADNFAAKKGKIEIAALSAETGETVWRTDKLRGFIVQVSPVYDKDILVLLTVANNNAVKDKPDITALKMSTGELLWNAEYTELVDLYGVEKTRRSGASSGTNSNNSTPRRDLSGENPPLFDSDSMYLTYAGLHRYALKDGKLLWKNVYDVTEGSLKLTNARPIVDGETIYTSAKGILRAINKSDGAVRWTTKDLNKGGVAQTILHDDVIYGRLGGLFYSHKQKDFLIKEPIGVVALDKHTGNLLWEYKDARNSITNMVLIPEQNTLLIADNKRLIGLDTTSRGRVKESYKVKLEFKTKLGFTDTLVNLANMNFFGGATPDAPVALMRQENGTVVARGKQHLMAFNPQTRQIVWSTYYKAPSIPAWQKISYTAINIAAQYYGVPVDLVVNLPGMASKRFSATKQNGNLVYVLTTVKSGTQEGTGLIGIDMMNGQGTKQIMFKDRKPDYEIDEASGRFFNLDAGQIIAYNITEAVQAPAANDKQQSKK